MIYCLVRMLAPMILARSIVVAVNRCADDQFRTDAWNRCTDEVSRHTSLQMVVQKVKVPGDQTNNVSVDS